MPNSSRMTWPYPAENQQPWFDALEDLIAALDASGFASREDRSIIFTDGGSIAWNAGSSTLSWSSAIRILAAITGFTWNVQPATLTVDDGKVVYVELTRGPTTNLSLNSIVASQVPSSDSALILCVRIGDRIYWRNGAMMNDGDSFEGIGGGGGGGPTFLNGDIVKSFSDFQEAATGEGWLVFSSNNGQTFVATSLTKEGFPSNGVAVLSVPVGGVGPAGKVQMLRPGTGLLCDADNPPSITYRIWLPQEVSGDTLVSNRTKVTWTVGVAGGTFGPDGPSDFVAFRMAPSESGIFQGVTIKGGPPTIDACTGMPGGDVIQVRITINTTNAVIEVSNNDGASYVTVCTTSVAPTQTSYFPFFFLEGQATGLASTRVTAVDWMLSSSVRDASGAGSFDGENALPYPQQIQLNGTDATIQSVGVSNLAGTDETAARADHSHAHANQGGGTLHAAATTSVAGFMSSADKTFIDRADLLDQWWKFSGVLDGAAALTGVYLGDGAAMKYTVAGGNGQVAIVPEYRVPAACTLRDLRVYAPANSINQNVVVTVYKNGVATTLTCTVTASTTGSYSDTTHTVSFAADDRVSIFAAAASNGTGSAVYTASLVLRRT